MIEATSYGSDVADYRCRECDMTLWNPIFELGATVVGLYDDARFPGRCIVMFRTHTEYLDELQPDEVLAAHYEVKAVTAAIRSLTGARRVNYAVLGNAEPHLHWRLIPRYPASEVRPEASPWSDPRPHSKLPVGERDRLIYGLRETLVARTAPLRVRRPSSLD